MDSVQPTIVNQVSIEIEQLQLTFSLELMEKNTVSAISGKRQEVRLIVTAINKCVNGDSSSKNSNSSYHVVIVEHNLNWKLYTLLDRKER